MTPTDNVHCGAMGKRDQNISNQLREKIKAAEKAGTTRADIARRSKVSESQISRFMGGKSLTVETLERLAGAIVGGLTFRQE